MATKLKSHKGASKRVRITKKGKVIADKSCNNHLLTNKGKNNKKFRYGKELSPAYSQTLKALLPYGL